MYRSSIKLYSILLVAITSLVFGSVSAQTNSPELRRQLSDLHNKLQTELAEKGRIRLIVRSLPTGGDVFESGSLELLPIASLQKLFLTYAALNILGAEYKFPTEFFTDYLLEDLGEKFDPTGGVLKKKSKEVISSLGNLYIRGYGNPGFLHENIMQIARELKARGLDSIQDIVVDDTLFIEPTFPDTDSPYKAGASATAIEFNTYRVDVKGGVVGEKPIVTLSSGVSAKIENRAKTFSKPGVSLEIIQNPDNTSFLGKSLGKSALNLEFFKIAIEGRIGVTDLLSEKYLAHPFPSAYFAASFKQIFSQMGISIKGDIRLDEVPEGAKMIYTHESKPMHEILADLNHYSSNFIAGQLLYAIGQETSGRFSRDQGLKNLESELVKIKNFPEGAKFLDGSGLNKDNRATLNQIVTLIQKVYSDPLLAPPFLSSLSRYGVSGTLKNRNLMKDVAAVWTSAFELDKKRSESIWAKTGTIDGVSGVAGIAPGLSDMIYLFAIVVEGNIPKEEAIKIEDSLVGLIAGVGK